MVGLAGGLDRKLAGGTSSILVRTLRAEYLLSRGYLAADLDKLPPQQAKRLMKAASQFATLRLVEIESSDGFPYKNRLWISLN